MKNINYDLVIIGGGTSGCAAAYNASLLGLKTLLVEKNNFLGGLMTGGLVVPVMKSSLDNLNSDYYKKLVKTAKKYKAQITYKDKNDGWFNPEVMKIVIEEVLSDSKIRKNLNILYETSIQDVNISNKLIKSVILNHDALSIPVYSTHYVDATGSASLAQLCGCNFINDTDIEQQSTLRFILSNVNIDEFCDFITKIDCNEDITNTYRNERDTYSLLNFTTASTWDTNKIWAVDSILKKGVKDGVLIDSDRSYFQIFSVAGSSNQVAFNCPRINTYKNNPYMYSNELINARMAIWRIYNFVKKYFKGFENAEISNIATQTGIRESRRVQTKYIYKNDDMISNKKFENSVLKANYSMDIHSKTKNKSVLQNTGSYELPIESLISKDIDNLYVAGKIIGAQFEAHSALRVQKSCMQMGEGLAKYIAGLK